MKKRDLLLLAFLATGCDLNDEPMQNSPATDQILDHFAAGLRFGDSFEAAAQRGLLVDSHLDESGSTMQLTLPHAKYGMSRVRLLGTAAPSGGPESPRVYRVILFSRPDSAQIALSGAKAAAMRIFESSGQQGCIGYRERHTSRVTVWENDLDGGMALVEPVAESTSTDEALTRLIVYPHGRKAADAVPGFRTTDCQE